MSRAKLSAPLMVALLAVAAVSCSGDDAGSGRAPDGPAEIVGPLCEELPQPGDPGGPDALIDEPIDVALTWVPVGTVFEAAARATGMDAELADMDAVTVLIPTDGAFDEAFGEDRLDELLLSDHEELREILERHIVEGTVTIADLEDAGEVTTIGGDTFVVALGGADGDLPIIDGKSGIECGDYLIANGAMHVVSVVLGDYPPRPLDDDDSHLG